jgi:hypothetical protein
MLSWFQNVLSNSTCTATPRSDEFDGDALDAKKWTPRANASAPGLEYAGGQQQWYSPDECKVVGGALALRTRRRAGDFFLVPGAKRASASEYPFVSCWVGDVTAQVEFS